MTISCLLIQPNPASALNEAAGKLASEDWDTYCRRARLMTEIHAAVPRNIANEVKEAQVRGEDGVIVQNFVDPGIQAPDRKTELVEALPSTSGLNEDEEKSRRRRRQTREPESDPESDWILRPDNFDKLPVLHRECNVFGIKGLNDTMQMERSSKRIPPPQVPFAGLIEKENVADSEIFVPKDSEHRTEPNPSSISALSKTRASSGQANTVNKTSDTTKQPGFFNKKHNCAGKTSYKHHPLFQEFSFPWAMTEDLYSVDLREDKIRSTSDDLRMTTDSKFKAKQDWEKERFKKAGYSLRRYNRGNLKSNKGIYRL